MKWKSYLAAAMTVMCLGTVFSGCSSNSNESSSTTEKATEAVTEAAEKETETDAEKAASDNDEETKASEAEKPTEHISPMETVSAALGTELSNIDAMLDRDGTNTYKAKLSDMIEEGDTVNSFTFIFYSSDDVSDTVLMLK